MIFLLLALQRHYRDTILISTRIWIIVAIQYRDTLGKARPWEMKAQSAQINVKVIREVNVKIKEERQGEVIIHQ